MATGGDLILKDQDIEDLAQINASKHMATIAIKYLGLPQVTVQNLNMIHHSHIIPQKSIEFVEEQKSWDQPGSG